MVSLKHDPGVKPTSCLSAAYRATKIRNWRTVTAKLLPSALIFLTPSCVAVSHNALHDKPTLFIRLSRELFEDIC